MPSDRDLRLSAELSGLAGRGEYLRGVEVDDIPAEGARRIRATVLRIAEEGLPDALRWRREYEATVPIEALASGELEAIRDLLGAPLRRRFRRFSCVPGRSV